VISGRSVLALIPARAGSKRLDPHTPASIDSWPPDARATVEGLLGALLAADARATRNAKDATTLRRVRAALGAEDA